jgi:hypothetical protein
MTPLFADENVRFPLVVALRDLGHDVVTALQASRANQGIPDADVLIHATALGRAVLTNNNWDFQRLHTKIPGHAGIVTFTDDADVPALAARVDAAIRANEPLAGKLIKITRPP